MASTSKGATRSRSRSPRRQPCLRASALLVRRRALRKGDVVTVRGLRATSVLRTLRDLCSRLPVTEAVVLCDMALHRRLVKMSDFSGTAALQKVSRFVEPAAESPMESRLRMLLVLAGLPRPEAQVDIRD